MDYNIANLVACSKEESMLKCQQKCQQTVECDKFSYVTDTYNGRFGTGARKNCCLKPAGAAEEVTSHVLIVSPSQNHGKH